MWASAFVAIRFADRELSPGALALGRLLVGSAALGIVVLARREPLPGRASWTGIVVCGVLWFGVYNVALNAAERRVDAGTAAMLVNIGPILIAILAGSHPARGLPAPTVRGLPGRVRRRGGDRDRDLGARAPREPRRRACASWRRSPTPAASSPRSRSLRHASPLVVTWLACTIGAISCLPYAGSLVHEVGHAGGSTIAWMIYLGVAPTAAGFVLWAYALARTTAGRMGSTTYLVPPLALLFGWAFLGEVPPALVFPGGALCLAGVALARTRGRARYPPIAH